jgi:hypothetical protein
MPLPDTLSKDMYTLKSVSSINIVVGFIVTTISRGHYDSVTAPEVVRHADIIRLSMELLRYWEQNCQINTKILGRKHFPMLTLSKSRPTWTVLEANPSLYIDRQSYGMGAVCCFGW